MGLMSLTAHSLSHAAPTQALPQLLQEVEKLYTKSQTLSADFTQVTDDAILGQKKKSSGKIFVKRPSQVRWETTIPDPSLFVSNGKMSWFYSPPFDEGERGQVIERKSSEVQSKLANALLSGSFSIAKDMKITAQGQSHFMLIPKPGSAGTVTQANIEIHPEKKLIQKVTLEHKGGNKSEISLNNIQLGIPLGGDLFVFHPPKNTDIVKD
jgi:outer membrane lipoprotein carrier protein